MPQLLVFLAVLLFFLKFHAQDTTKVQGKKHQIACSWHRVGLGLANVQHQHILQE